MFITKRSMLTGHEHTMDLNVTIQQIKDWEEGTLIQDAMPNLNSIEREFIISGVTEAEWNRFMKEEL
jgi:hypothetical protein